MSTKSSNNPISNDVIDTNWQIAVENQKNIPNKLQIISRYVDNQAGEAKAVQDPSAYRVSDVSHDPAAQDIARRKMANIETSLKEAVSIDGAVVAALVDYTSGMTLGTAGDASALNLDVAAAGNTDVVRAKMRTMQSLGLNDNIEDILITLGSAYHMIRLISSADGTGLFLYLVLDKNRSNLALARHKLTTIEKHLEI